MRRWSRGWIGAALACVTASGIGLVIGCENTAGDCQLTAECAGPAGSDAICDPSQSNGPVEEACGVFVSAAAKPGGDGSRSAPFATFVEALAAVKKAESPRIYVCAGAFAEVLDLPPGLTLYGGLDCAKSWAHAPSGRTTIAPPSGVPITFEPGATIHVEGVHVIAPDGAPADGTGDNPRSGGSSIGAVALPSADVEIVRSEIEAGKGAEGAAPTAEDPLGPGAQGKDGAPACDADGLGGAAVSGYCADPSDTTHQVDVSGGRGGDGSDTAGAGMASTAGAGTSGGAAGAAQTDAVACQSGMDGQPGKNGPQGAGGSSTDAFFLSGYKGYPGKDGTPGDIGGGGGGGGGGKACSQSKGAGGGSGGVGGCGGAGGLGGGAGGSSIALWAVSASVFTNQVTLTAGAAGQGAPGAAGQVGGAGGSGGHGGTSKEGSLACNGGSGAKGGDGGPGGGGQGGSSIALFWKTTAPKTVTTTLTAGLAGQGAPGGPGSDAEATGQTGLSCQSMNDEKPECLPM